MKAFLLIGANRPERCRSAAITCEICAPMSPCRKSVMAIGSGSTLPLLMLISTSAFAGVAKAPAVTRPTTIMRARRREDFHHMTEPFSILKSLDRWGRSSRRLRSRHRIYLSEALENGADFMIAR